MRCQIPTVQTCGKLFKVLTLLLMQTLLTKTYPTMVEPSLISNRNPTYSSTTMPESANSTCHDPTVISTDSSKNVSMHHLLTMKAVLHSSWANYNLPLKGWKAREQLTFQLRFSKHLVLWPYRNYYPYSTHHFHLLIVHKSGGLPLSSRYSKLGNLLVKSHLSIPSASPELLSNFWNIFLLTVFTTLPKPTTCSVNSRLASSPRCNSGQKLNTQRASQEVNYFAYIQHPYHQSHGSHFLGLA